MLASILFYSFLPNGGADTFDEGDVTAFGTDREQAPLPQSNIDPFL
ncbi:MAG: hypothetical protein O3C43_16485 [Verrucomicrobia bacterium]|nr:hypothetical protein [Verrucomicrobiota bacterium]MDA1068088.1 hypothetical protein [Verrucomicrobiota bacterium]